MFVFLSLILCLVLTIIYYINLKNSDYWKKKNVIQEKDLLWDFVFGETSLAEVYKKTYDKYPNAPHVGIFLGSRPALLLRDIDNVQAVFAGDFHSFYSRGIPINPNDTLADNVLFIDDYARWKILRQKLSPVFTSSKLKNMFYILNRCAQDFVKRIEDDIDTVKSPFDALYTYTTASIAASIFGIDAQIKNTMDSPFLDMAKKTVKPSLKSMLVFTIANISPRLLTLFNLKTFGEHEEFFIGVVRKVIKSRKMTKENRHDFIDICLELQKQGVMKDLTTGYELEPTVEILAAQAFFFFIAGADTSATTLHFTLLELSYNPEILEKVHEEIDKVFESCNEKITFNEIEKFKYLEMVLNESMRKYPAIGSIQRRCTKNTVLPVGNLHIEKDSVVIVPVFGIQRDDRYYPDPDKFDPERFSAENIGKIPKFAYLPFGEGNRICLGMRFARLQTLACLAWLLRRYTLQHQPMTKMPFERSFFALRVPNMKFDLVPRNSA